MGSDEGIEVEYDFEHLDPEIDRFTAIPNRLARNHGLSTDARAILFEWLSHDQDRWRVKLHQTAQENDLPYERARKAVRQLRDGGYVHLIKHARPAGAVPADGQKRAGGTFAYRYIIVNRPVMQCRRPGCQDCSSRETPATTPTKTSVWSDQAVSTQGDQATTPTTPTITTAWSTTQRSTGVYSEDQVTEDQVTEDQKQNSCPPHASREPDPLGKIPIPRDFQPDEASIRKVEAKRPDWQAETPAFVAHWAAKPGKSGMRDDWQQAWRDWMERTRIPENFRPTAESVNDVARCRPDVDWRNETMRFRAYWESKPGLDGRKADWQLTWRNWMKRSRAVDGSGRQLTAARSQIEGESWD